MQISPPSATVSIKIDANPQDAENLAKDAAHILEEENSEAVGEMSPAFKKLLEVLQLLPQQFS